MLADNESEVPEFFRKDLSTQFNRSKREEYYYIVDKYEKLRQELCKSLLNSTNPETDKKILFIK